MDPQERLFLEVAWRRSRRWLHEGGYRWAAAWRFCRGYVGTITKFWRRIDPTGQIRLSLVRLMVQSLIGSLISLTSWSEPRPGYHVFFFPDRIHLACEALRGGDIDAAIAGGVNLTLHPYKYLSLSQGKVCASDGKCRSFGEGGDGYVPGEG